MGECVDAGMRENKTIFTISECVGEFRCMRENISIFIMSECVDASV